MSNPKSDVRDRPKFELIAATLVLIQVLITLGISYACMFVMGYFLNLSALKLSLLERLLGTIPLCAGIYVAIRTFSYRNPVAMMESTAITFIGFFGKHRKTEGSTRKEPFIPVGPYKFVRNPLYFAVVLLAFGFTLIFSSLLILIWAIVLIFWFWFILIPYEENELAELFGQAYLDYRIQVPRLFPNGKRYAGSDDQIKPGR